ncbi:DNA-binding CsgD family transcriptional regulator [Pseudofulvimonas gallinarii]|uniref:DNA-binding CsgD family transcriptional regulator n=2 Tax=Pseudofulvimonas gallinarii TaxID=634155 RepID=A0A4R3KZT7_9GAMM|nr:DNA-binding CsgD family transcriptional regulator [Pseudofulvimonas gallinarii]
MIKIGFFGIAPAISAVFPGLGRENGYGSGMYRQTPPSRPDTPVSSDALIHALYAAVGDDAAWNEVVRQLATACGAGTAMLVVKGEHQRDQAFYAAWNHPEASARAYSDHWWRHDPFVRVGVQRGLFVAGTVMLGSELVPPRQLLRTAFYRNFLRHIPARHLLTCVVSDGQTPDQIPPTHLSLFRPDGEADFDAADKHWLATLLPHLQRAFRQHWRVRRLQEQVDLYRSGLDELDFGVLLLDPALRVHYANPAARRLLDENRAKPILSLPRNDALAHLLREAGGEGAQPRVLVLETHGRRLLAMTAPMPVQRPAWSPSRPDTMLLLTDQDDTPATLLDFLAQGFGLSRAEARLLPGIYRGQPLGEIADALGIKPSTARSQLSSILARTGCQRQQDLLRLLGKLPPLRET